MEKKMELLFRVQGLGYIVPLKWMEYGIYGDLIIIYPKPYSIYLRGTIDPEVPTGSYLKVQRHPEKEYLLRDIRIVMQLIAAVKSTCEPLPAPARCP